MWRQTALNEWSIQGRLLVWPRTVSSSVKLRSEIKLFFLRNGIEWKGENLENVRSLCTAHLSHSTSQRDTFIPSMLMSRGTSGVTAAAPTASHSAE